MNVAKLSGFINNFSAESDTLSKVSINICYPGKNQNRSYIDRETLETMSETLFGCALVGKIDEGNFTDHGEVLRRKSGGWEIDYETQAYGFVPKDPTLANVRWEKLTDENGEEKEYLSCDAFLWTGRYPEIIKIFQDHDIQQSMEIWVQEGHVDKDDDLFYITQAVFIGLCMLGTAPPAFEDAKVQMYTTMPDAFLQTVEQFKKSIKEEDAKLDIFNHEEYAKQNFDMTANQLRELLQKAVDNKYSKEDYESRYWIEDYSDSYVYTMNWFKSDRLAFPYSIEEGEATIDFEQSRKYMMSPVFVEEVTEGYKQSAFAAINEICDEQTEDFKATLETEEEKFNTLQDNFNTMQSELETVKEELADVKEKYSVVEKENYAAKAKEIYESDNWVKRTVSEDEASEVITKFEANMDLDGVKRELNLLFSKKVKEDPSILQNRDSNLNFMDAGAKPEDKPDKQEKINNGSPYPGESN